MLLRAQPQAKISKLAAELKQVCEIKLICYLLHQRTPLDIGSGYTYFNTQTGREFSVVAGFTHNFKNHDTQYRNGNNLHLDWSISQHLSKNWHAGLVGYYYYQITGDSGSGALLGDFKSRINGIGPQVSYQFMLGKREYHLNLRGYKEFGAENRPEGWNAWITITIPLEGR